MRTFHVLLIAATALGCASTAPEPFQPSEQFRARRTSPHGKPPRVRLPAGSLASAGAVAPYRVTRSATAGSLERTLQHTFVPGFRVDGEESLRAVVDRLRQQTGLPLVVDQRAENAALDEGAQFSFAFGHPLSARDLLELITDAAGPEVEWTIRHGAVLVTTRDNALDPNLIVAHDVQDLAFGRTDFVAPRLDRLRLLDELEDDDGYGPFGGEAPADPSLPADELVGLVKENVDPGLWERDGISIDSENGFLIIVAPRTVQVRVRRFLDELRGF